MMPALPMMITDVGKAAIVNAQEGGTDAVLITEIGLTNTPFIMAPTLTALPGELRRIDGVAGQSVADNIIHIVAYDPEPVTYTISGFGLYDSEGTLIAVHSSDVPILTKATLAVSLLALDIALNGDMAAVIEFGDPQFLNPPASETVAGVVKISTNDQADAAEDDTTAMSPAKVARMIAAALDAADENVIKIWSGAIEDIRPGWQLCDGTNGTPDLRDKFVIGAGGALDVGDAGGAATHDHGGTTAGHALTVAELAEHRHLNVIDGLSNIDLAANNSLSEERSLGGDTQYLLNAGVGEPNIGRTGATGAGDPHAHDIDAANHLPPFYALAFIMKV